MLKQPLPVVQASSDQADIGETVLVTAWVSSEQANMAQVALGYALRFGQEHSYRFDKQALLWEQPRLHTPEQFELWNQIVAIAHYDNLLTNYQGPEQQPIWQICDIPD